MGDVVSLTNKVNNPYSEFAKGTAVRFSVLGAAFYACHRILGFNIREAMLYSATTGLTVDMVSRLVSTRSTAHRFEELAEVAISKDQALHTKEEELQSKEQELSTQSELLEQRTVELHTSREALQAKEERAVASENRMEQFMQRLGSSPNFPVKSQPAIFLEIAPSSSLGHPYSSRIWRRTVKS